MKFEDHIDYDPVTGIFTRKTSCRIFKAGSKTGAIDSSGYVEIVVSEGSHRHRVRAHRLGWFLHTGEWPAGLIDHINGNRSDNRFENLRVCTNAQNLQNQSARSSHSRSGLMGAHWHAKSNLYRAHIKLNGKKIYLGSFADPMEAHLAYCKAKLKYHTFNPVLREAA